MTLVYTLQFVLVNISSIIQSILFLVGLILVIIPLYHVMVSHSTTFLKASEACKARLGMHRFINMYYTKPHQDINDMNLTRSPLQSSTTTTTTTEVVSCSTKMNTKLDTSVCLASDRYDPVWHHRPLLVSGLVNTGNSCFLNSVLQSLSSLPKLQTYLNSIDMLPTTMELPVTRSLLKTLKLLTVPSNGIFQPIELVTAMSSNRRVINREQQDAQELFQLISGELDNENQMTKKKQGFRDLLNITTKRTTIENPFTGLLANRLSCIQCGYTEAIRHFSFNNVQLTLPNTDTTTLDDCLKQLTTMEYLNDVTCRKCSLIDTVQKLSTEIETLQSSDNKFEKLYCLEKIKKDIEHRLDVGRIAEESHDDSKLKGFLSKVSRNSSKQAMFAKPPKILCLHMARSTYLPTGEIYKNTCQVQFPQLLDLAPYCTNGTLNTGPLSPISSKDTTVNVRYKLMSSIVHFGSHNFGHFIAYKRRLVTTECGCHDCIGNITSLKHHESEWYKISDERVDTCSVDEVLSANPYMLLYELIEDDVSDNLTLLPTLAAPTYQPEQLIVVEESESEESEGSITTTSLPNTPPSSPFVLPLQLTFCSSSSSFQPLTTPTRRRRDSTNNWNKTPVAIY